MLGCFEQAGMMNASARDDLEEAKQLYSKLSSDAGIQGEANCLKGLAELKCTLRDGVDWMHDADLCFAAALKKIQSLKVCGMMGRGLQ